MTCGQLGLERRTRSSKQHLQIVVNFGIAISSYRHIVIVHRYHHTIRPCVSLAPLPNNDRSNVLVFFCEEAVNLIVDEIFACFRRHVEVDAFWPRMFGHFEQLKIKVERSAIGLSAKGISAYDNTTSMRGKSCCITHSLLHDLAPL